MVRLKCNAPRPFLDGRLDDEVWQTAQPLTLASRYGEDRAWPAIAMLACDGEFVYFAATCRRAAPPVVADQPAAEEPELERQDRVEVALDVNRDWHSQFTLVVDCRGKTSNTCVGDRSWDPQWFVAPSSDETSWTIEAAIGLAALGVDAQAPGAWGVSVKRVAPGHGVQSWAQPASVGQQPATLGLVVFE
jgi:hypothetical protein